MTSRYLECLSLVLQEETSYTQRSGGPYVRKVRLRDGNRGPIVATAVYDEQTEMLVWSDRVRSHLPTKPDGCAYDDDPDDTGGRTCMGILQREYDAWRSARGLPCRDVWMIGDREIEAIFEPQYWTPLRCSEMPAGVDYFLVDFGFACGIGKAAERLQRVLGVKVDRHVGVGTIAAVQRADPLAVIEALGAERESYYRSCKTFWKHGPGWLKRNQRVGIRARTMVINSIGPGAESSVALMVAPAPIPETPSPSPAISRDSGAGKTVSGSKTIWSALGLAGGGTLQLVSTLNQTASETKSSGLLDFAASIVANLNFWVLASMLVMTGIIFRERLIKILTEGR